MSAPDPASTHFQAAVEAHQRGDLQEAERLYRLTLELAPGHGPACNNLGLALAMRGDAGAAIPLFRRALALDPGSADAAVNLAQALEQSGHAREALAAWREALCLAPQHMEPALGAAAVATNLGEIREAAQLLERAAARPPRRESTPALLRHQVGSLAEACLDAGDPGTGHRLASLLARLDPDDPSPAHLLERCLRGARVQHFDPSLERDLLHYHRSREVDHKELSRLTGELLRARYPALDAVPAGRPRRDAVQACGAHGDELLLALLERGVVVDAALEASLTDLRRALLDAVHDGAPLDEAWRRFLAALAIQCFTNEHVFADTGEEAVRVQSLEAHLDAEAPHWEALAVITCYRAPVTLAAASALADRAPHAPEWIRGALRRCLLEPLEERVLRDQVAGAVVRDPVSREVQRQYEESPYPRWLTLTRETPCTVAGHLRQVLPAFEPAAASSGPVPVLVAGCGTGQHALRTAARHPDCPVTGIDLSAASLAYALRKARELGIGNLSLRQADILDLVPADGPFDLIESSGVLHHMADPAAGLEVLVGLLGEGGVIKLGLYSRAARRLVNRARARIAALGLAATPADMRRFRQRILRGEEPELSPLAESLDLHTTSTLRDLLFHVHEHQFDVPGLRALVSGRGLRVIGLQVADGVRRRYLERFPNDPALACLDHWQAFEAEFPDTFAGMYQIWCTRA